MSLVAWMDQSGRDDVAVRPWVRHLPTALITRIYQRKEQYQQQRQHQRRKRERYRNRKVPTEGPNTPITSHPPIPPPQPHNPRITITAQIQQHTFRCLSHSPIPRLIHPSNTSPRPPAPNRQPAPRAHAKAWPAKHSAAWLRIMLKWGQKVWGSPRGVPVNCCAEKIRQGCS